MKIDDYLKLNQEGIRSRKELVLLWQEQDANPTGNSFIFTILI